MRENKSPWLHNFKYERQVKVLTGSIYSDIAILGGGIAGVTTAYMLLKHTDKKISIIEGDLIAHGATGHNAGYVTSDCEKPFKEIVAEHGLLAAKNGSLEWEEAYEIIREICKEIGENVPDYKVGYDAYKHAEDLLLEIEEQVLKYGELRSNVFVKNNFDSSLLPKGYEDKFHFLEESDFTALLELTNSSDYIGSVEKRIFVLNSARFSEAIVKYLLRKYSERFQVFEKSFIHSIRLLENSDCVLDAVSGVLISDKVILCTNGFENFGIYGPFGTQIDKHFHHNVSGVVGYMTATFSKDKYGEDRGRMYVTSSEDERFLAPHEKEPYIYLTKRHFDMGIEDGELVSIGGPEVYLHDRRVYKKDHEVDEQIYKELEDFQKKSLGINENPTFKWHGLMGYTKTGIRIVGQDKRFLDLYYNLGCNGIGVIPSVAGAKRIARLISGEKLPKSIFDPR